MAVLIDTNFLLAMAFPSDSNYRSARQAMRDLKARRIIAAPVLPEMFFMITARVNYSTAAQFFKLLQSTAFQIEPLIAAYMTRMSDIITEYEDNV